MATLDRGAEFGSYRVEDLVGKGGMGEVYLARHKLLPRPAAIKKLRPALQHSAEHLERFLQEAAVLVQLRHASVVALYDLVETRGEYYMVLEYVDGFDVAQLLEAGRFPAEIAATIGMAVADALGHAHGRGIIHRDIKPANCMVSVEGEVKLMDFGIARDLACDGLTRTGMLVGTPKYMAPELLMGGPADSRSDIYSLGALLYQVLTAQSMFADATPENLAGRVLRGKYEPLRKAAPGTPWALRRVVNRCLRRDPDKRYQTAAEVRHGLETFLLKRSPGVPATTRLTGFLQERDLVEYVEADSLA